eukprot:TRINITY_DN61702_c0_g1_i1.p1 TRINITY_DN61702_c0_g1~~TRINITY_DN61702_c0_g1_i1.p1  ORF type:complete len:506 (+),score=70.05 TRINITY_DN61702_c0_g1_i1:53-1570(+)
MQKPKVHRILLIGRTGEGKSTLTNFLLASDKAKTSFGLESCTKDPEVHRGKWRGTGEEIEIIDTPGLLDSDDGNMGTLKRMKLAVTQMKDGIKAVLFVQGLNTVRMDSSIKMMLELLDKVFPEQEFWDRSAVVFSHWDTLEESKRQQSLDKWKSELPGELQSCKSRLNLKNVHVYKGQLDPNSLDGLFPFVRDNTDFTPKVVTDVAEGKDEHLLEAIAQLKEQLLQMQLKHEQERNELLGELKRDAEKALERQLAMQREFSAALAARDKEHMERMERQMQEHQKQMAAIPRATGGGGSRGSCFLPTAKIDVHGKGMISASEVQIGDKVLGWDTQKNSPCYSEVYFLACDYDKRAMINVFTQVPSKQERCKLTITPDHLVLTRTSEGKTIFKEAGNLTASDKITVDNEEATVVHMEHVGLQRQCFILTKCHTIFVDGFLLSCFEKDHDWYIGATSIVRGMYNTLPSKVMKSVGLRNAIVQVDAWLNAMGGAWQASRPSTFKPRMLV